MSKNKMEFPTLPPASIFDGLSPKKLIARLQEENIINLPHDRWKSVSRGKDAFDQTVITIYGEEYKVIMAHYLDSSVGRILEISVNKKLNGNFNAFGIHNPVGAADIRYPYIAWGMNGFFHREDGPARINCENGEGYYFLNGHHKTKEEFDRYICRKRILKIK